MATPGNSLPLPGQIGRPRPVVPTTVATPAAQRPKDPAPLVLEQGESGVNPAVRAGQLAGNTPSELGRELEATQLEMAKMAAELRALRESASKPTATPVPPKKRGFVPTAQHDAIFSTMVDPNSPGLGVLAVAGSGKTSTLVAGTDRMLDVAPFDRIQMVAFNKANAETMRHRLPAEVESNTIHSLCWSTIKTKRGWKGQEDARIQSNRVRLSARTVAQRHASGETLMKLERELEALWGLGVSTMTALEDKPAVTEMASQFGADVEPESQAFELVSEVDGLLRQTQHETISYDEMLRIVVEEQLPLPAAKTVLVDEVQDLNRLQMEIVAGLKPRKVIVVGDPRQAIYAFRGSDQRAVDTMCKRFGIVQRLPLSTTYRCAKAITAEARRIVRDIQPLADAPEGDVFAYEADRLPLTLAEAKPGDLVICRSNAPLIAAALFAQVKGLWPKIRFLGGDSGTIANALDRAQRQYGIGNARDLASAILADNEAKTKELQESGAGAVADAARDRSLVLALLLLTCGTIPAAQQWIKGLAATSLSADAVNCATIHRAKGSEADRVLFLGSNLVPSRMVMATANSALITQEWNMYYVAVTRASKILIKQELDRENLFGCLMDLLDNLQGKN